MGAHPEGQRLQPPVSQPSLVWAQHGPDHLGLPAKGAGPFRPRYHDAAQDVVVAGQVFGQAMDDIIGPMLQRAQEVRGGKGVVHQNLCAHAVRRLGQQGQVRHHQERVGHRLQEKQAGTLFLQGGQDLLVPGDLDEAGTYPQGGQRFGEQGVGDPIEVAGGDDRIAAAQTRGQERRVEGGHSGSEGDGTFSALQGGYGLFQSGGGRVAVAGVDIAGALSGQNPV